MVTFRTTGHLATAAGLKRTEVEVSGNTLKDFMEGLIEKVDDAFRKFVYPESGKISEVVQVQVNGKNVQYTGGLETELKEGDVVSILPLPVGG